MKLCDTNIIIYAAQPGYAWLAALWQAGGYVSETTWVETLGYQDLQAADERFFRTAFQQLTPLPITRTVVEEAIRLRRQRRMKLGDALIAATAALYSLPLVTRNEKDFSGIAGLTVFNPLASNG